MMYGLELIQRVLVNDRWKYCSALFDGDEMYDLKNDPFELNNLIDSPEHFDICCDLRNQLFDHIESTNDYAARFLKYWLKKQNKSRTS